MATQGVYWVGANGNVYAKAAGYNGVQDWGAATGDNPRIDIINGLQRIADPNAPAPVQSTGGGGGGGAAAPANNTADNLAYLSDQESQLRGLLGRTDTGLNQGLTKLGDDYNRETGYQDAQKTRALQGYADNRIDTNKGKLSAYDTINKNANTGYRSLAQIIGHSAGTGSSAFQELLPNVVGKDTSNNRRTATETYGKNLQGIDKAQNESLLSFQNVLDDLLRQRQQGESDLRSGIEGQRQNINSQLAQNAAQRVQALGGAYDQVHAAQAPFQAAIENSRNAVEGFFNQFRTPYTRTEVAAATPDLAAYNVDRSSVNAQAQPGSDPNNPYASLLRKKLQEGPPV